ncbi:hypothetical protein ACHHYP_02215 [Achlya hypogyna]|uniref:Uncharacterized protein n=1 Tax=Achlya hypogyna TaxID=1202772 RepID=A0A1V9ZS45_ACHHY|nr:hypothetical protein ACHHYP_02215 [Achlya hypogyna]
MHDYAEAKLSAWERERKIRFEAKQRREKLEAKVDKPTCHIPKPSLASDHKTRVANNPKSDDAREMARAPEFKAATAPFQPSRSHPSAPTIHVLAPPKHTLKVSGDDFPQQEDDVLSVASDSTCSEGEVDHRLVDSLDLSIAMTPPKSKIKPRIRPEGQCPGAKVQSKLVEKPALSRPVVGAPKHHQLHHVVGTAQTKSATPAAAEPPASKRSDGLKHLEPAVPLPAQPSRPVDIKLPIQPPQPSKGAGAVAVSTLPPRSATIVAKPVPTKIVVPAGTTTLSMEESELRRAIAQLDSKLGDLRHDTNELMTADDDTEDTLPTAAYGGGAHIRVGTRTAHADRCSLEKRRGTSSVHATRVRKGPAETPSLEKPAKADKVVVKKEFAYLFL